MIIMENQGPKDRLLVSQAIEITNLKLHIERLNDKIKQLEEVQFKGDKTNDKTK